MQSSDFSLFVKNLQHQGLHYRAQLKKIITFLPWAAMAYFFSMVHRTRFAQNTFSVMNSSLSHGGRGVWGHYVTTRTKRGRQVVIRKSTRGHMNKRQIYLDSMQNVHTCPLEGGRWSKLGKLWPTQLLNETLVSKQARIMCLPYATKKVSFLKAHSHFYASAFSQVIYENLSKYLVKSHVLTYLKICFLQNLCCPIVPAIRKGQLNSE